VEFFGSLRYRIISSANKDILTVSLPICIPLFLGLISGTAINKKDLEQKNPLQFKPIMPKFVLK
jgi:hypothetical protein